MCVCVFRGILSPGAAAHPVLSVQSVVLFIVLSAVCAPCPGRACSPCRPVSYNPDLDHDQSVHGPPILPIHQFAYLSALLALSCPVTTKITICPSIHLFVCSSTCLSAISLLPLYFTLVRYVTSRSAYTIRFVASRTWHLFRSCLLIFEIPGIHFAAGNFSGKNI